MHLPQDLTVFSNPEMSMNEPGEVPRGVRW